MFYYWDWHKGQKEKAQNHEIDYDNINDHSGHTIGELYIEKNQYSNFKEEILNYDFFSILIYCHTF